MNYTDLNKQQTIDVLSIIVAGCPHINFRNSGKWLASKYEREVAINLIAEFSTELEEKYSDEYIRYLFSRTDFPVGGNEDLVFDWTDLQLDYFYEYNNEVAIAIGDSYKKLGIEKSEVFDGLFWLLEISMLDHDLITCTCNECDYFLHGDRAFPYCYDGEDMDDILDKFYQETGMDVLDLINKRLSFEEEEFGHQYSVLKFVDKKTTEIYDLQTWIISLLAQSMLDHELDGLEKPYSVYGWELVFVLSNLDKFYQETGMDVLGLIIKRLSFEEEEFGHQYSVLKKYSNELVA